MGQQHTGYLTVLQQSKSMKDGEKLNTSFDFAPKLQMAVSSQTYGTFSKVFHLSLLFPQLKMR